MANQANYPIRIRSLENRRPHRLTSSDFNELVKNNRYTFFAGHPNDNVEVWVYNSAGNIVGTSVLDVNSEYIYLYTIADGEEAGEYLGLDMESIIRNMGLPPGRYSMVANILRDEVGSFDGDRLKIEEISSSRREVRLAPTDEESNVGDEIREFVTPAVPRAKAQALLDQVFNQEIYSDGLARVSAQNIRSKLEQQIPGTNVRMDVSGATTSFENILETVKERTYTRALQLLASDSQNFRVTRQEFMIYVREALKHVLEEMNDVGEIDPRLELIG